MVVLIPLGVGIRAGQEIIKGIRVGPLDQPVKNIIIIKKQKEFFLFWSHLYSILNLRLK